MQAGVRDANGALLLDLSWRVVGAPCSLSVARVAQWVYPLKAAQTGWVHLKQCRRGSGAPER